MTGPWAAATPERRLDLRTRAVLRARGATLEAATHQSALAVRGLPLHGAPADVVDIFGRVKRGGGYNVGGANGWEWFELKNLDEQQSTIIWRGVGPPVGEMYAGDPNGGCNGCHGVASSNDFVLSEPLTLKNF